MTKVITYKKEKGCPSYINGFLVERIEDYNFNNRFSDSTKNIDASLNSKWYENLPEELLFISWDKPFLNDIKTITGGSKVYLITQKFLNVINKFDILDDTWIMFKVKLMYERTREIVDEQYYIIHKKEDRTYVAEEVLDSEQTIIKPVDFVDVEFGFENDIYEDEKKAYSAKFINKVNDDLFLIKYQNYPFESNLYRYLYCSDAFAIEFERANLKGCHIIDIENIADIDPVDLEPYAGEIDYPTEL